MNLTQFKAIKLPLFIAACLLSISVLAWFFMHRNLILQNEIRFKNLSSQVEEEIRSRMLIYINTLLQTRSLFAVTGELSKEDFRNYINRLELQKRFPGIQGIGYTKKILPYEKEQHENQARALGDTDYKIWPSYPRDVYFSIIYLEPLDWRNRRAIGYDMFTEPHRREAMEKARDSGKAAITKPVKLVQETEKDVQTGFLIYAPIYRPELTKSTVEERRKKLLGFIYSPFRVRDLFKNVFRSHIEDLGFEIYLGEELAENKVFTSHENLNFRYSNFQEHFSIDISGGTFTVKTYSLPSFEDDVSDYTSWLILITGGLISFLSYLVLNRRELYLRLEKDRAAQNKSLVKIGRTLSAQLDLQKLVRTVTDAGLDLTNAKFGAFIYTENIEHKEFTSSYCTDKSLPLAQIQFISPVFKTHEAKLDNQVRNDKIGSLLSVPVISHTGEMLGGLFYGHPSENNFTKKDLDLVEGIAAQAAIALDNAKLFLREKKAVEARDQFLSIASHELKTPITSMKLQFEMAQRLLSKNDEKVWAPEIVSKRVKAAISQLNRMNKLIEDMLESSRLNSDKLSMDKSAFDLNELMEDLLERFSEQVAVTSTKITFSPSPEVAIMWGDKFRIEQVFLNLITNALKYGEEKPIFIAIELSGRNILTKVKDQGIGIEKEASERIFQRFERAVSSNEISGLGLGLYITKQIIDRHDGKIWVESEPGKGATFMVEFPQHTPV